MVIGVAALVTMAMAQDKTISYADASVQIAEAKKQIENVTAILSQSDERLYAEAGRLFNQRKFSDANDMMEILWKSPAARRSRKVIDLRKRIARRL